MVGFVVITTGVWVLCSAYLEMYEGTTAVNAAANKPAADRLVTSVVNRKEEMAALAEKIGAMKTHT